MPRKTKKSSTPAVLGLALLAVLVFLMFSFTYQVARQREGNEEKIQELRAELDSLRERKTDLEMSLGRVDDREYIERVLREDFLMKKPGEEKVIILTEEEEEEEEEEKEEESRFERIMDSIPFIN